MERLLLMAAAAALPLLTATAAQAQMKGLTAGVIADVARTRELDLRLSRQLGNDRPVPLMRGMIVHRDVAPNAVIGLGLANVYSKRRGGSDLRIGERPSRSRKPAITFVLKF